MWFDPAELTNAPVCPPATSATLRPSEELPAIAAPKVAKSQESQAPRVRAPARDTPKVGAGDTAATSWGWRVTYPKDSPGDRIGGHVFECYIVPLQTLAEVQAIHPGAKIEPIAEAAG